METSRVDWISIRLALSRIIVTISVPCASAWHRDTSHQPADRKVLGRNRPTFNRVGQAPANGSDVGATQSDLYRRQAPLNGWRVWIRRRLAIKAIAHELVRLIYMMLEHG